MQVLYDKDEQKIPIKVWADDVEPGCVDQLKHLSNLPFAFGHVAAMPDTHQGYGMPIGGVLATKGVIIPNAVGVDIGCGMACVVTNIPAKLMRETKTGSGTLLQQYIGCILRNIPTGFSHHRTPQPCKALDAAHHGGVLLTKADDLLQEIQEGYYQVGTLGGGNHFIEVQETEDGYLALMIHSGSRNFGKKVCDYYNKRARQLNQRWYTSVPDSWELAFLPEDSDMGMEYITWMKLALDFAQENRDALLMATKTMLYNHIKKYTDFTGIEEKMVVNCHHNYAVIENHYGENVWVHRKGAIRARKGDVGIIPGSMGTPSYIVQGLGSKDSFCSSSHGAGRNRGRKQAMRDFTVEQVVNQLNRSGIVLGKHDKKDLPEEAPGAYKDIDLVISQEADLVTPIVKLRPLGVIKG